MSPVTELVLKVSLIVSTALALSMLLASLGTSIANIALPTMAGAFAAPFRDVQWVVIAYLAAMTVSVSGADRLAIPWKNVPANSGLAVRNS